MAMGGSGVSASGGTPSEMSQLVELMKFFGDKDAVARRMGELASAEAEVDAKLTALGGLEHAKSLIDDANAVRAHAETFRTTVINEARDEADKLKSAARAERAEAEALRKRTANELMTREETLEGGERDYAKRKKALEQAEAVLRSGQEKLRLAEREADELRNILQSKIAASKKLWAE